MSERAPRPIRARDVFILGGAETDFALAWHRRGGGLFEMMSEATQGALLAAHVDAGAIGVIHVGNFAGELFTGQGHLGALCAGIAPAFDGLPTSRHEAACASGSMAILAAMAELECERYDVALVVGVEEMRNVPGERAAVNLAAAARVGHDSREARYLWPAQFSAVMDEYDRRYGLDEAVLGELSRMAFDNARRNPRAQARSWTFTDSSFARDDEANPVVEGRVRRQDCAQITDGAAALVLANARGAAAWAQTRGRPMESLPRITGFGHRGAPLELLPKLAKSRGDAYLFPQLRLAIRDALSRAALSDVTAIDGLEVHDCFTITALCLLEHAGLAAPGRGSDLVRSGALARGGDFPLNAGGGLIGGGHPVGATGVRMLLDASRHVSGGAGDYQIEGARTMLTINIGGSTATSAAFVVQS